MNADRLSREYVIVDVTVDGEPPAGTVRMAIMEGDARPSGPDFTDCTVEEIACSLLVAMSASAPAAGADKVLGPSSFPTDFGVWMQIVEGSEDVVKLAGTLTVL